MWDYRYCEMGWNNGDRLGKYQQGTTTNLRAYRFSNNLGVRLTTDPHIDSGCIWRLCISYCNLNKITGWFKYSSLRFDNIIIQPGKSKYLIKKMEANFYALQMKSCLIFSTRNNMYYELFVLISSKISSKIWNIWKRPLIYGTYILT